MTEQLSFRRWLGWIAIYWTPAIVLLVAAPFWGPCSLDWSAILRDLRSGALGPDAQILLFQRIPRVALALLVGGTLSVVGASFQVILRNPLAEPYTLGTTGGAAVGAAIVIAYRKLWFSLGPFSTVQLAALIGAMLALGIIYAMANRATGISTGTLLLAGVTVSILSAAAVMLIRYIASPYTVVEMDRWMMGGLAVVGYRELSAIVPLLLPGLGLLLFNGAVLNHLALGKEMAAGHGVDVAAAQRIVFLAGGLATAAVVSVAGPIGFVGLIVPHAVRRISGYDHRLVLPASFAVGGGFLILCDAVARTALAPTELPVGIITALVGGPIFIRILLQKG